MRQAFQPGSLVRAQSPIPDHKEDHEDTSATEGQRTGTATEGRRPRSGPRSSVRANEGIWWASQRSRHDDALTKQGDALASANQLLAGVFFESGTATAVVLDVLADRYSAVHVDRRNEMYSGEAVGRSIEATQAQFGGGLRTLPDDRPRDTPTGNRRVWTARAYFELIRCERGRRFGLRSLLDSLPVTAPVERATVAEVASALTTATRWLPMDVECLTRAAALTGLLRRAGQHARLLIGVQQFPFVAHAWVMANDRVVADEPELPERLAVLLEF